MPVYWSEIWNIFGGWVPWDQISALQKKADISSKLEQPRNRKIQELFIILEILLPREFVLVQFLTTK